MLSAVSLTTRWMLSLLIPAVVLMAAPSDSLYSTVGLLTAAAALAIAASFVIDGARSELRMAASVGAGPAKDERCLHGSFRRQSSPDTAGRPQPRAPGIWSQLA